MQLRLAPGEAADPRTDEERGRQGEEPPEAMHDHPAREVQEA